jgi:hypothetical protein
VLLFFKLNVPHLITDRESIEKKFLPVEIMKSDPCGGVYSPANMATTDKTTEEYY